MYHLLDNGYIDTAARLQTEANISSAKFELADNMSFDLILREFDQAYEFRVGKKAKYVRKSSSEAQENKVKRSSSLPRIKNRQTTPDPTHPETQSARDGGSDGYNPHMNIKERDQGRKETQDNRQSAAENERKKRAALAEKYQPPAEIGESVGLHLLVHGALPPSGVAHGKKEKDRSDSNGAAMKDLAGGGGGGAVPAEDGGAASRFDNQLLKPLPRDQFSGEFRELAEIIQRDIYSEDPNVRWHDVAGHDDAIRLLKEAVVLPMRYPQLFSHIHAPWRGVLLYGPPGTGKTMLAKAVASECRTTFFNISASTIVSKWRGDSEKLVRVLFELARFHAPSTIFIDEIDAILSHRSGSDGAGNDHEGSRRMKTELLVQMDGLSKSQAQVFVLCASNLPWELDTALLRRLEKRIMVPLPNEAARLKMFKTYLPAEKADSALDYQTCAAQTSSYSGSDIAAICKEALMMPIRRILPILELEAPPDDEEIVLSSVTVDDVVVAMGKVRPAGGQHAKRYATWHESHGAM
jgi:katanin p60 ATPase-containing subunit A1